MFNVYGLALHVSRGITRKLCDHKMDKEDKNVSAFETEPEV